MLVGLGWWLEAGEFVRVFWNPLSSELGTGLAAASSEDMSGTGFDAASIEFMLAWVMPLPICWGGRWLSTTLEGDGAG